MKIKVTIDPTDMNQIITITDNDKDIIIKIDKLFILDEEFEEYNKMSDEQKISFIINKFLHKQLERPKIKDA